MSRRRFLAAFVVLGAACSSTSGTDVQQTSSPATTAAGRATARDPRAIQVAEEMLGTGMIIDSEATCIEQALTDRWTKDPASSFAVNRDRTLAQQHIAAAMGACIDVRRFSFDVYVGEGITDKTAVCIVSTATEADLRTVMLVGAGADPADVEGTLAEAQPRVEAAVAACR